MGSRPWKQALLNLLSPDREGETMVVVTPRGERVEGMFVGTGSRGSEPYLMISTAPEGMRVRDPGYFDYERWVKVERGLMINGIRAENYSRATSERSS